MKTIFSRSIIVLAAMTLLNGSSCSIYASPFDEDAIIETTQTVKSSSKSEESEIIDSSSEKEEKSGGFLSSLGSKFKKGVKAAKNIVVGGYEKATSTINNLANKKKTASYIVESIFLPGHESKEMVCQGIAYLPDKIMEANQQGNGAYCQYVLLSYYPKDSDQPSQIVVVDRKTEKAVKRFALYKSNGKAYTGHAGGIAVAGKYLWVASGNTLYGYDLQEIIDFIGNKTAEAAKVSGLPNSFDKLPGKDITTVKTYKVDSKASFVSFDGKYIWVGDFTKGKSYKAVKHHKIMGRNCWIAGYLVDSDGYPKSTVEYCYKDGDDTQSVYKPDAVIAMRDSVQGMAVCGKYVALTVSYGATNSKLAIYNNPLKTDSEKVTYKPEGQSKSYSVDAWELEDKKNWLETVKIAAGAEDLEYDGKNLYVTFECSSKNYKQKWKNINPTIKMTDDFYLINPETIVSEK